MGWTAAGWAAYAAAVVALTWPVLRDPAGLLLSQWPTDADHFLWVQWWFERAVETPGLSIFHTDAIRFPETVDLQLADVNLFVNGLGYLLAKPLGRIGAYNALLWGSFLASAGLMWRLGERVSGDRAAGWTAGLAYAASPYWIACALNSWAYLVHVWVFPLVALALLRAAKRRRLVDFAALGGAVGLAFHVTPYYFLYLAVLGVALAPWFARDALAVVRAPGGARGVLVAAAVALCIVAPRAWPMIAASQAAFAVHSGPDDTALAARWVEFFWPRVERPDRLANGTFLVAFLGYTLLAGIAGGLAASRRRRDYRPWLASAALLLVLALGPRLVLADGASVRLPEHWLMSLPGFRFTTNHWRWTLPAQFCLTVAFALGLADLRGRVPAHRRAIAVAATLALVAEVALVFPFPLHRPLWPRPYDAISPTLRDDPSIDAVLDLRPRTKIRQTVHGKRIVGGWLPRVESESVERTQQLMDRIRTSGPRQAQLLGRLGIGAIVVDERTAFRIARDDRGAFELRPLRAD